MPISVSALRDLISFDPKTGRMWWKDRPDDMRWSSRYSATEAFLNVDSNGYLRSSIFGKNYRAHRVLWALVNGCWPRYQIDHIDGDRANNAISNLREVTNATNCKNKAIRSDNTSGCKGVRWHTQQSKWRATIHVKGKEKNLGCFDQFEDAVSARDTAKRRYGYTERHGEIV